MCWNVFSDFFCTSILFRLLMKKIYIDFMCLFAMVLSIVFLYYYRIFSADK